MSFYMKREFYYSFQTSFDFNIVEHLWNYTYMVYETFEVTFFLIHIVLHFFQIKKMMRASVICPPPNSLGTLCPEVLVLCINLVSTIYYAGLCDQSGELYYVSVKIKTKCRLFDTVSILFPQSKIQKFEFIPHS